MEALNIGIGLANIGILYLTVLQFHLGIPLIILVNVAANLGLMMARFSIPVPTKEGSGNPLAWMLGVNIVIVIASFVVLMQRFSFFLSAGILALMGLLFGLLFAGYMYYKLKGVIDVAKKMPHA